MPHIHAILADVGGRSDRQADAKFETMDDRQYSSANLTGTRVLADICHPSQAWVLRPVLNELVRRGAEVEIVAREKDSLPKLLERFGIPFSVPVPRGRGLMGQLREFARREAHIVAKALRTRPALLIGTSFHIARAGFLSGGTSFVLNEDDARVVPLVRWLGYPLASRIVTPRCLAFENYGRRHLTYRGSQKLFYLHPSRFQPDPSVRAHLGPGRYAIVRLSALDAHHDRNIRGLATSDVVTLQKELGDRVRLVICSEGPVDESLSNYALRLPPELMHHALAFADFFIGDSQSMTVESALLGVPAIRVNDFVGRISILRELESAGLCFGFVPEETRTALDLAVRLTLDASTPSRHRDRLREYLSGCDDPVPWLLGQIDDALSGARP
jgi:predicted glycosyltransferase